MPHGQRTRKDGDQSFDTITSGKLEIRGSVHDPGSVTVFIEKVVIKANTNEGGRLVSSNFSNLVEITGSIHDRGDTNVEIGEVEVQIDE